MDDKKWKGRFLEEKLFQYIRMYSPDEFVPAGCGVERLMSLAISCPHTETKQASQMKVNDVAKTGTIVQNRSCQELRQLCSSCNCGSTEATRINRLTRTQAISTAKSRALRARTLEQTC